MKNKMVSILILALLAFWIPCASAEISQDLDPMVPVDSQATVTGGSSVNNTMASGASNVVSTADATVRGEKKADAKKVSEKKESKKSSSKKSSSKKNNKSSSHKQNKKSNSDKKNKKSNSHKKDKKLSPEKPKTSEDDSVPKLS